jgi:hypothetical protein
METCSLNPDQTFFDQYTSVFERVPDQNEVIETGLSRCGALASPSWTCSLTWQSVIARRFLDPLAIHTANDIQLRTTTSKALPTKKRKRKAPTLRTDDFEPYKARIIELHIDQNIPLPKVKDVIESEYGFRAEYVTQKR